MPDRAGAAVVLTSTTGRCAAPDLVAGERTAAAAGGRAWISLLARVRREREPDREAWATLCIKMTGNNRFPLFLKML